MELIVSKDVKSGNIKYKDIIKKKITRVLYEYWLAMFMRYEKNFR